MPFGFLHLSISFLEEHFCHDIYYDNIFIVSTPLGGGGGGEVESPINFSKRGGTWQNLNFQRRVGGKEESDHLEGGCNFYLKKLTKIWHIFLKKFFLSTTNKFAIQNNPLMQLRLISCKTVNKNKLKVWKFQSHRLTSFFN